MRALVIHEMYEVLRRHSATVRFQHGAPPDIIGTTHISPPQCVKPPAIPRFVPSFFTPARDLRAQIHLPCRRASASTPLLSIHALSSHHLSLRRIRRHPPRRRYDCTSLPVKFSVEYGGRADRERRIDPRESCRRHGVQRQSKRRGKYWPTIFYLFRASVPRQAGPMRESNGMTKIDGHSLDFRLRGVGGREKEK